LQNCKNYWKLLEFEGDDGLGGHFYFEGAFGEFGTAEGCGRYMVGVLERVVIADVGRG
jgi:hypothetical protein